MAAPDPETQRLLGSLLAEVQNIKQTLAKADQGRAAVHRRINDLVDDLGRLNRDVGTVKSDIAGVSSTVQETKDVTDEVRRWKQMGIGALAVVGIGGTALGATLASSLDTILKIGRQ